MKVADMILAEYADGRFNKVGGGPQSLSTGSLPFVVPSMYLFLKFRATGQDAGVNRLEIRLVGRDRTCFRAEGSMTVVEDGESDPFIDLPLHFRNTLFDKAGDYDLQVFINGRLGAERPFQIRQEAGR